MGINTILEIINGVSKTLSHLFCKGETANHLSKLYTVKSKFDPLVYKRITREYKGLKWSIFVPHEYLSEEFKIDGPFCKVCNARLIPTPRLIGCRLVCPKCKRRFKCVRVDAVKSLIELDLHNKQLL